jgi:CubicO group peptidase (beta-lactamase class C family)/DNA-binding CsgD family transcriptional regulator
VASVPYLAGRSAAFGKERAKGADAALDQALKELVAMEGGPPGVIAVVQRDQHRKVHTFGVRNIKSGLPMRVDDRMRIASAAKAFSGAGALSLVSKGALSLNDTIGELLSYLPKPPPDAWAEVSLRQLLNHTSGLPDIIENPDFQEALGDSPTKAPPPEKLLTYAYYRKPPLRFDPGSKYQYSNSDNIAVALMVEAATGTSYEEQLRERVYRPLGLKKTSLPRGTNLKKPFIHGYSNDPSQDSPEDVSEDLAAGWSWASGGIVSRPADLNDFIRGYVGGKLFAESLALGRELDKTGLISSSLINLGFTSLLEGDAERAETLTTEAVAVLRERGHRDSLPYALDNLGWAALSRGDPEQANDRFAECLVLCRELNNRMIATQNLEGLACAAGARREDERSARLFGAADTLRGALGYPKDPRDFALQETYLSSARSRLDETAWEAAFAEGRAMNFDRGIEYALSEEEFATHSLRGQDQGGRALVAGPLTPREEEVAALVAQGLTNRQIASRLVISESTAETHVSRIFKKLGLHSRSQLTL